MFEETNNSGCDRSMLFFSSIRAARCNTGIAFVPSDHVMKKSVLWCDSINVLYWVKNPSRKFKPFVANRIGEIRTATEPTQ